jgi:hypothetical protein
VVTCRALLVVLGTEGLVVLGVPGEPASYVRWTGTYEDGLLSGSADYMFPYYYDGSAYYFGYRYTLSVTVD